MSRLGTLTSIRAGKLDANASLETGKYPFFTCSKEPLKIDTYSYDCECVLVAGNGDLNVKYYNGKFDAYQRTYIIESIDTSVLYVPYLYLFLDNYLDTLRAQSIGGVIKYIKLGNLTEAEIPLPPLAEQRKIAAELDKISGLIAKRKSQIEKLDLLVKAKFVEMFGDMKRNNLGWEIRDFNDFAIIDTKMTKDFKKYANYPHIGIDSIEKKSGQLMGYRTVEEDNVISGKYLFSKKHIIYSKIRPNLNKVATPNFEGVCSADAYPILPKNNCKREYLVYVMRSQFFLDYILAFSSRTNLPKVNKQQVEGFFMPLPPLPLQIKFVDFVQKTEQTKSAMQKSLAGIETLYKSRMQEYFE